MAAMREESLMRLHMPVVVPGKKAESPIPCIQYRLSHMADITILHMP